MRNLHKELQEQGHDSYIFWGRRHETINDHEACCASKFGVYTHGALSRFTDRAGFYSKRDTRKLLERLDKIDPDVVHLHNIHGYYVNIGMLFEWLATKQCQVKWTLHDCWAFTGHCAHFAYAQCDQWKCYCGSDEPCSQLNTYPRTISRRSYTKNFAEKKHIFNLIPPERMILVSPSKWLADLVGLSFLSNYPIEVRRNTIDTTVFRPTPSDFRDRYGIGSRFMILGVASPWTERKGLDVFFKLARELDSDRFAIVLVGLSKKQVRRMPEGVIGLTRTDSPEELAGLYTAADIFFNPTREDNYPTVNLEAQACGTPVFTFDTGGCSETVSHPNSRVIDPDKWSVQWLLETI